MAINKPISVIMPVYNNEPFLRASIESILNQTFADFEYIIVDDCSSDDSLKIIQSYDDARIRLIKNEKNLGVSESRNIGIKVANGKYLAMMDADDISLPERFARQYEFMESNPHIDVCGTQRQDFGTSSKKYVVFTKHEDIVTNFLFSCKIVQSSVLLRQKTILSLNQLYDSRFDLAEDYEYWIRLFLHGATFANLDDVLLMYRWHSSNGSVKNETKQKLRAQNARKQIFRALGIRDIENKAVVHELMRLGKFLDITEINEISLWIRELVAANEHKRLFPKDTLNKRLTTYWFNKHNTSGRNGLGVWHSFKNPPVPGYKKVNGFLKLKLLVKCLLKVNSLSLKNN